MTRTAFLTLARGLAAFMAMVVGPLVPVALADAEVPVDVELVLAVDTSSSMRAEELGLQRAGYAAAFRSREVLEAIRNGLHGRIAVTYVEWGAAHSRRILVPWTVVSGPEDAETVATLLDTAKIKNLFQTSISGAIRYGVRAISDNGYRSARRVIDISGDGPNNQGGLVTIARDDAVSTGITVNGLPLLMNRTGAGTGEAIPLDLYYAACVIGGPGSFSRPVNSWEQFPDAVRRKLVQELAWTSPAPDGHLVGMIRLVSEGPDIDCSIGEKLRFGLQPG